MKWGFGYSSGSKPAHRGNIPPQKRWEKIAWAGDSCRKPLTSESKAWSALIFLKVGDRSRGSRNLRSLAEKGHLLLGAGVGPCLRD